MKAPKANQKGGVRAGLRKVRGGFLPPAPSVMRKLTSEQLEVLDELQRELWECVFDPTFVPGRAEREILSAAPTPAALISYDTENTPDLDSEFGVFANMRASVLSAAEEKCLFQAFNYCRYRVMKLIRAFRGQRLTQVATRELLDWHGRSREMRGEIARLNISLVLAMARRARISGVELSDLVCEGNVALLRCVDKFDVARGFKFSTYACRAILSAFTRIATKNSRHRQQFPVAFDTSIERSDFLDRKRAEIEEHTITSLRSALDENKAELSDVEQQVIEARFALKNETATNPREIKGMTLEEVGDLLGVSKERVRQIQNKALSKLREVLHVDYYNDYSLSA